MTLAEEATVMLQGPGQRFDFHMSKTLCDLRSVLDSYHKHILN